MTYYPHLELSSNTLAGAVAEAALHDLQVNNFTFPGFPQISVKSSDAKIFTVTLTWLTPDKSVSFDLTATEAKTAVKRFHQKKGYDPAIFPKVQDALVKLEGAVSSSEI
jgi:hypothetical protein